MFLFHNNLKKDNNTGKINKTRTIFDDDFITRLRKMTRLI